jgi:hypothetical protein
MIMGMKRSMTEEDLRDKGLPFACNNCGRKPTLEDVLAHGMNCQLCGDEVFAYTEDTAKLISELTVAKEMAERQVAVLCRLQSEQFECCPCPAGNATCDSSSEECRERLVAWSRAEASKQVTNA